MAIDKKDQKIVDKSGTNKSEKRFVVNSEGKIVEAVEKPKQSQTGKRILACILWVLALGIEILAAICWIKSIELIPGLNIGIFIIIALVIDLICVIIASLLWKNANHKDPASEENKVAFWFHNNFGVIMSVLCFLPFIIIALADKDAGKGSKISAGIIALIAAAAMLIAGFTSYDYHPISKENIQAAQDKVNLVADDGKVFWTDKGIKYHVSSTCFHLSNSVQINTGFVEDAYADGKDEMCLDCYKKLAKEKGIADDLETVVESSKN